MKNLFNFIQHIKVKKYHCDNKNTNTEKVLKHINLKQNLKKPTVQLFNNNSTSLVVLRRLTVLATFQIKIQNLGA